MEPAKRSSYKGAKARSVHIPLGPFEVRGELVMPMTAQGIVVFAGDSPQDESEDALTPVVQHLQLAGFGTLRLEAMSHAGAPRPSHAAARELYDMHRDVQRLLAATDWLIDTEHSRLPVGYVGAGAGAASILHAAAARPKQVKATVIIDGGAELAAGDLLERVEAKTLCVTTDEHMLRPSMLGHLQCEHKFAFVKGLSPLQDGECLAETCQKTSEWFRNTLVRETLPRRAAAWEPRGVA